MLKVNYINDETIKRKMPWKTLLLLLEIPRTDSVLVCNTVEKFLIIIGLSGPSLVLILVLFSAFRTYSKREFLMKNYYTIPY